MLRAFPPGKSGGLIEARDEGMTSKVHDLDLFPPGKSGGLIEAENPPGVLPMLPPRFPPGKSGGLIEAFFNAINASLRIASFRRVNPAASLKPSVEAL